ncbi:glycosyltransferase family 76 protein [Plicaturopsis crispa FD-325 SS-3]|nr:glycosyltransferase family 76 protein [Plicaturopsis crispa FD-325 SS-3]
MPESAESLLRRDHRRALLALSIISRLFTLLIILLSSHLPLFDASPRLHLNAFPLINGLLRWDAFHFGHIAQHGYVYEHLWAFFPGTPFIMRLVSTVVGSAEPWARVLIGGAIAATATITSVHLLYDLTLELYHSSNFAFLAALLSLLPASPSTLLFASYTEPFFTYLSYRGMLYSAREKWVSAAVCFALAGAFRGNGIFLSGFIIWGRIVHPFFSGKRITFIGLMLTTLLVSLVIAPFIAHNYAAYRAFCLPTSPSPVHALSAAASSIVASASAGRAVPLHSPPTRYPEWCNKVMPSIYSHVQRKYWGNGLFSYWKPQNIPNFILPAPALAALFYFSFRHIAPFIQSLRQHHLRPQSVLVRFATDPITPHALYTLFFTIMLVVNAHTQIVLRLAASMPAVYWAGAALIVEGRKSGRLPDVSKNNSARTFGQRYVGWSIVWGAISVVLWSVFLPPA